jgi:hypothetical protein
MNVKKILPWHLLICIFLLVILSTFFVKEGFYLSKDISAKDPSGEYASKLASAIDYAMADTSKKSFINVLPQNTSNVSGLDQKISGLLDSTQRMLTVLGDMDSLRVLHDKSSGVLNLSSADLPLMLVITSTGPVIYKDKMAMASLLTNLSI